MSGPGARPFLLHYSAVAAGCGTHGSACRTFTAADEEMSFLAMSRMHQLLIYWFSSSVVELALALLASL